MIEEEPKGERKETNGPKLFPWLLLQQTQGQTLKVLMARTMAHTDLLGRIRVSYQ